MSKRRFIQTLQALLTMVDPKSPTSVACVIATLENIFALAKESQKSDHITLRIMMTAKEEIHYLILHKDDFAGKPGDLQGNTAKQHRLEQVLTPGC